MVFKYKYCTGRTVVILYLNKILVNALKCYNSYKKGSVLTEGYIHSLVLVFEINVPSIIRCMQLL